MFNTTFLIPCAQMSRNKRVCFSCISTYEAVRLPVRIATLIHLASGSKLRQPFSCLRLDTPTDGGLERFADKYGQGPA